MFLESLTSFDHTQSTKVNDSYSNTKDPDDPTDAYDKYLPLPPFNALEIRFEAVDASQRQNANNGD